MSIEDEVIILRKIPMFSKIDVDKLKLLAFTSRKIEFSQGETIFNQAEHGESAYIIMQGVADVMVKSSDQKASIKVAQINEHEIVGEIAILCDIPRTASLVAQTDLVTLEIPKSLFSQLLMEYPEISLEIMRELADRLSLTTQKLHQALIKNTAEG